MNSNDLKTWNAVLIPLARKNALRVTQLVCAPIATQRASGSVYPIIGIDVEDNAALKGVVANPYKMVMPKIGRSKHDGWAQDITILHSTKKKSLGLGSALVVRKST